MNERAMRHENRSPEPVRQSVRAYEQPPVQGGRAQRMALREEHRGTERHEANAAATRGDGYWFRQWVDAPGDSLQGDADGAGALSGLIGPDGSDVEAFVDQLAPRLRATPEQGLQMLLHLPHLGRISVSARRQGARGWDIDLRPETDEARDRLSQRARHCEDALAESLGEAVTLRVGEEEVHG